MTTLTLTVTDFVLARIAEDEATAKLALAPKILPGEASSVVRGLDGGIAGIYVDPARVLAQCAAMRKIVEEWTYESRGCDTVPARTPVAGALMVVIKHLASIWSDHPSWREEWRA